MEPTQKDIDPQSAPVETPAKGSTTTETNAAAAKPESAKTNAAKGSTTPAKLAASAAAKVADEAEAKPTVQRVRLVISSDNTPEGKCDVSASDGQGGQYLIKRDEEVDVPIGVYNVLRCANTEVYQTDANDSVTGSRSVPRFNIRVVG